VLLILGTVARYVFRAPQVWVDELTSLLFVWLAMLGMPNAGTQGRYGLGTPGPSPAVGIGSADDRTL
jgi:hypothetical protein